MNKPCLKGLLPVGLAAILVTSCGTPSAPPLQSAQGFNLAQMDEVYLVPVVEARVDRKSKTDVNRIVQKRAAMWLKIRGYKPQLVEDASTIAGITGDDLREAKGEWITRIGPAGARWMMVFAIEELKKQATLGAAANAEMTLTIVDKQAGAVVWRDKTLGQFGMAGPVAGLASLLAPGAAEHDALWVAVDDLVRAKFPKRK